MKKELSFIFVISSIFLILSTSVSAWNPFDWFVTTPDNNGEPLEGVNDFVETTPAVPEDVPNPEISVGVEPVTPQEIVSPTPGEMPPNENPTSGREPEFDYPEAQPPEPQVQELTINEVAEEIKTILDNDKTFETPFTEAIVILGKSMARPKYFLFGEPVESKSGLAELDERLEEALRLIKSGIIGEYGLIIVAGGNPDNTEITEAEYMRDWLMKEGINRNRIIMEDKSKNTKENYQNIATICHDLEILKYVVFSTDVHIDFTDETPFFDDAKYLGDDVIRIEYKEHSNYKYIETPWWKFWNPDFDNNLDLLVVKAQQLPETQPPEESQPLEEEPSMVDVIGEPFFLSPNENNKGIFGDLVDFFKGIF
ncbi:MAG: YdcF family protein, partial [Nanoarchaeota archaeon]|nr:YdcF family protein [Nanoarchaeota archaeon]